MYDELTVGPVTTIPSRTNDAYITSKVKARFVEANKFSANHVKVVTERKIVYLMGLVSRERGGRSGADRRDDIGCRARRQAVRVHRLAGRSTHADAVPRMPDSFTTLPEPCYPAKIATRADALARIRALARPLVFTNGVFDILHRGHVDVSRAGEAGWAHRWSSPSTPMRR